MESIKTALVRNATWAKAWVWQQVWTAQWYSSSVKQGSVAMLAAENPREIIAEAEGHHLLQEEGVFSVPSHGDISLHYRYTGVEQATCCDERNTMMLHSH